MKHPINVFLVSLVSFLYAITYWSNPNVVVYLISTEMEKPFVYRQLIPIVARAFVGWGMDASTVMVAIAMLCGAGLYVALCCLVKNNTVSVVASIVGMVLFIEYRTVYDLATAVLWTSAFCLLRDGKHKAYLFVFVLACLNRIDTAPFLALLHFAYFRDWKWAMVQGAIFVSVFGGLRWMFFDNVGLEAWVMPISNVQKYLASWQTMFWLSALIVSLCFVFRGWASKPLFLRYAFVILFPIFVALHIVFGQPFEFRVFWEVYPLIVSLMVL